jgi:uncharacterized membrane protein YtjA (UPF0391 family)
MTKSFATFPKANRRNPWFGPQAALVFFIGAMMVGILGLTVLSGFIAVLARLFSVFVLLFLRLLLLARPNQNNWA